MTQKSKMVPEKTVERLCLYRRILDLLRRDGVESVYSKDIADRANTTAEIVRRDLMNIGYTGNSHRGYKVEELLFCMRGFFKNSQVVRVAIIGMGLLGKAVRNHLNAIDGQFDFRAGFDLNNEFHLDDKMHHIDKLSEVFSKESIETAIICVPYQVAQEIADLVCNVGVHSIVNFAPIRLKTPEDVYVESIDITTLLEKLYILDLFIRTNLYKRKLRSY